MPLKSASRCALQCVCVRLRDDVSSQGTDEAEREANFFAASLPMPREFLKSDLEEQDSVDLLDDEMLRDLAHKYG